MGDVNLTYIWRSVKRRLWVLCLGPLIIGAAAAGYSFFLVTPQFESHTTLLVNQKQGANSSVAYDAILANVKLVSTYSDIIKSWTVEHSVIQSLGLTFTEKQLDNMIQVTSPSDSQVIQISVTSPNQHLSTNIANTLASTFQTRAQEMMQVDNVQIVDPAIDVSNPSPVSSNKKLDIAVGCILGLMGSVALVVLLEITDTKFRSEEDVTRYLNLPVLASVAREEVGKTL